MSSLKLKLILLSFSLRIPVCIISKYDPTTNATMMIPDFSINLILPPKRSLTSDCSELWTQNNINQNTS